jgi:signal transduction histidine kinase
MMGAAFVSDITQHKRDQAELRNLAGKVLAIQESESRTLARELHDDICQKLAALGMEAAALSNDRKALPEPAAKRVRHLGGKIGALSEEVHRLARHLHSAILDDLGLESAVKEECLRFAERLRIPVEFQATGVPETLPNDIALCLFRVSQEGLRNCARHAGARRIRVSLSRNAAEIALAIHDDGSGFDPENVPGTGGLGLISMRERVPLVKGAFGIQSRPGEGTRIEARVPLAAVAVRSATEVA